MEENTVRANIDFVGTKCEKEGVREVKAYVYIVHSEAETKRGVKFMQEILDKLPQDQPFFVFEEPPKSDAKLYFRLDLRAFPIDAELFGFDIGYRQMGQCPTDVSAAAMEIYSVVRSWRRASSKARRAK